MSWKAPAVSTVLFPVSVDLDSPNPHRLSATQTTNDSVVTSTVPNIPGASAYVVQSNSVSVSHENVSSVELNTWSASSSLNPVSDKENRPPFALSSSATQNSDSEEADLNDDDDNDVSDVSDYDNDLADDDDDGDDDEGIHMVLVIIRLMLI
ncbi:hypothetical protein FBUS_01373 [Fasciolopsis buskii]|uniref:Uncharacterized protein n=1 Tax=Fasciolopsis buskii TaxID=27845 RepID=A0A8E0VGY8_9TREM|nr:hypothetical protein FBUS_01373 [Fasciolopsis buski]